MRRNSPQTARADSQEEVAMRYDDARAANEVKSVFRKRTSARRRASTIGDTAGARSISRRSSRKSPRLPSNLCHLYPKNGIYVLTCGNVWKSSLFAQHREKPQVRTVYEFSIYGHDLGKRSQALTSAAMLFDMLCSRVVGLCEAG